MTLAPDGLHLAAHAEATPDRPALVMHGSGTVRTYAEIDDASRRLARALRERGLRTGDHIAVLLDNQPAVFDVVWAAMRTGLHVTPVSWHLAPDEAGFIIADCEAGALVTTARLADVVAGIPEGDLAGAGTRLVVDGDLPGFERLEDVAAAAGVGPVPDEHDGGWMFYSSGTTGRPKGIMSPLPPAELGATSFLTHMLTGLFGFSCDTVYLSPAPLYHASPAGWTIGTQRLGGTVVVMERFDPVELLTAVERHRVTHVQLVPTHMIRLLEVPEAERRRFDLSSLEVVVHAAAPCPVEVKRRFIEWLGPIVHEYYSGSEGAGFCAIGSEEWLAHPGSVGRSMSGAIHVLDPDGAELPVGEEGEVWFETSRTFAYHRDPEKTEAAWDPRGWSWMGDIGRVDEEGYLYLTDRASHMIISGGVNIYPREAEDVLVLHPAVADVAVVGTPDPDMGEQVTAFVVLADGVDAASVTEADLVAWCRDRLSHFKCPRQVRFVDDLPRLPTGKLLKRLLPPLTTLPDPRRVVPRVVPGTTRRTTMSDVTGTARPAFRPLAEDDLPQLARWLASPHVHEWWRETSDLEHVRSKYVPRIRGEEAVEIFVIVDDGHDIGIIQRYRVDDDPAWAATIAGTGLILPDAAGIDYLIGEPDRVGRGTGTGVIREFTRLVLDDMADIEQIVVTPQRANRASCRVLEKAGYRQRWTGFLDTDDPADAGEAVLYVRHRHDPDPS